MKKPDLLISFSGGETSAYMTWWLLNFRREAFDHIAVVFANTGQENEATLEFVKRCDEAFGFGTVWIEGVQHHGERKSAGFKIVDFETASRDGAPFEDAIRKYGIPNQKFKDCTRNLKVKPIEAYTRSIGFKDHFTANGIRADEMDRQSIEASERRLIYPLMKDHPRTKPQINTWWSEQPFRLQLRGYHGNCKWCWKKTLRKHLTILRENPEFFDFPERMEALYGKTGPEFRKEPHTLTSMLPEDYRRTFFRQNKSTIDLRKMASELDETFIPASDDAMVFDEAFDVGAGCEESCELYGSDD